MCKDIKLHIVVVSTFSATSPSFEKRHFNFAKSPCYRWTFKRNLTSKQCKGTVKICSDWPATWILPALTVTKGSKQWPYPTGCYSKHHQDGNLRLEVIASTFFVLLSLHVIAYHLTERMRRWKKKYTSDGKMIFRENQDCDGWAVVVHGQEFTAGTCKRQPFGTGRNQAFEGTMIGRTFKQTTDNPSFLPPNWQMSWPQRKTTGERVYKEQETERPWVEQGLSTIMLFRSTTLNHLPRKPQWPQIPNKQPSQVSINKFWYFQPTDGQQANKRPTTVRLYLTRR